MKNKLMMLVAAVALLVGANVFAWDFNRVAVVTLAPKDPSGKFNFPKLPNDQDLTVQLRSDLNNVSTDAARKGNIWTIGCSTAGTSCTIIRLWNDGNTANPKLGSLAGMSSTCSKTNTRICTNLQDPKFCYAGCTSIGMTNRYIALDHNGFFTLATINRTNASNYTEAMAALFPK